MTDRREFPRKVKATAFQRAYGQCEICTVRLSVGKFHYDHRIPDAMGGEPTLENCQVLCTACHATKTPADVKRIAKTVRQRDKNNGTHTRTSRPLMGTKASGWRKPFNGPPERRY